MIDPFTNIYYDKSTFYIYDESHVPLSVFICTLKQNNIHKYKRDKIHQIRVREARKKPKVFSLSFHIKWCLTQIQKPLKFMFYLFYSTVVLGKFEIRPKQSLNTWNLVTCVSHLVHINKSFYFDSSYPNTLFWYHFSTTCLLLYTK